jgi:hypothetical protein
LFVAALAGLSRTDANVPAICSVFSRIAANASRHFDRGTLGGVRPWTPLSWMPRSISAALVTAMSPQHEMEVFD